MLTNEELAKTKDTLATIAVVYPFFGTSAMVGVHAIDELLSIRTLPAIAEVDNLRFNINDVQLPPEERIKAAVEVCDIASRAIAFGETERKQVNELWKIVNDKHEEILSADKKIGELLATVSRLSKQYSEVLSERDKLVSDLREGRE